MLLTSSISKAMSILCSGIRVLVTEVETSLGSSTRLFVVFIGNRLEQANARIADVAGKSNERDIESWVVACT